MALRKRAAPAGVQVLLKGKRALFIRELDRHHHFPGAVLGGVRTTSRVVPLDAQRHVCSDTDVVTARVGDTAQSVYKPFLHTRGLSN